MPKEFSRTRRVEEQLRRDLAEMIRQDVKEPELGMVSITEIRVSPDLSVAQVYVTVLPDDAERIDRTLNILRQYAGKFRGLLGKRMRIRKVPQLTFIYDDLLEKSSRLDHAIDTAIARDKEKTGMYVDEADTTESGDG